MSTNPATFFVKKITPLLKSLLFVCLCFTVGCKDDQSHGLIDNTPDFFNTSIHRVTTLKDNNEVEHAIEYIDSIRYVYANRSISDKYYVYRIYADTYERLKDFNNALKYSDSVLLLFDEAKPNSLWFNNYIWAYYFIADLELRIGEPEKAYDYYYRALSMAEKYGDKSAIGYYYLRTGHIVFSTEHYLDASLYFKQALKETENFDTNFGYFLRRQQLINNVGICYERMQQFDSSVYFYEKGLRYIEKEEKIYIRKQQTRIINMAKAVFKGNLGGVFVKQRKKEGVEKVLKESIDENIRIGHNLIDALYTQVKLSQFYIQNDRLNDAKQLLRTTQIMNDSIQSYPVYVRWNNAMWQYWDKKGEISKAYYYLQEYKKGTDSLHKSRASFSLSNVDYNVKNISSKYKISTLEQSAVSRKIYLAIAILLSFLTSVIAFLVIRNARRTRRHIKTLQEMNHQINTQKLKIKEAFDDLEMADNEKDRILKAVSHDMRSPINSAIALIDLFGEDLDRFTNEQQEYLVLLKNSCQNALALTSDLLEIATLEPDKLDKELIDINTLIKNRVDIIKFRAAEKEQKITLDLPNNHLSAFVNSDKFSRVVGNLITNAIKFSPENTDIELELKEDGGSLLFSIKDSGIGIPDNIKHKIFDIFTDAKRYGTSGEQPFGLGLSISKQIVEAHRGKIWFDSIDSVGTTFYVSIPLSS